MKPLLPLLLLAGCAGGDRGLETVHQPVVSGATAMVPGCPSWDQSIGGERETQSSNFGCATNMNLAAMVADPIDLLHGHTDAETAELATRAIRAWREQTPTSKSWTVTTREVATGSK